MKGDGGKEAEPRADERRAEVAANMQQYSVVEKKILSDDAARLFVCGA